MSTTVARAKFESHIAQIKVHQDEAMELMKTIYPIGSRVGFRIMSGQASISTGKVSWHTHRYGLPALRVLHEQAKPGSRLRYRDVLCTDVTGTYPA